MRLPRIQNYDNSSPYEEKKINSLDIPRMFWNLANSKDRDKFIKKVEVIVRSSLEYHELIDYLKYKMGMNFCSFFHNVSKDLYGKAKFRIEIHHEPFTLYDIVAIILNNKINNLDDYERIDIYDIADEVMENHYAGHVGLIPLSVTVHELVHSGKVFIPLQFLDEGYIQFYQKYKKSIMSMEGLSDMLKAKISLSKEYAKDPESFVSILKKKYIYVTHDTYNSIPDKFDE